MSVSEIADTEDPIWKGSPITSRSLWVKWNWYPMKPNAMMKNASDRLWEIPVSKDASPTEGTE